MAIADLTKLSLLTVMGVDLDYCSSSYWIVLSLSTDITEMSESINASTIRAD